MIELWDDRCVQVIPILADRSVLIRTISQDLGIRDTTEKLEQAFQVNDLSIYK